MSLSDDWKSISARIDGVVRAGELMTALLKVSSSDPYRVVHKSMMPALEAIRKELLRFRTAHSEVLPDPANAALSRFLEQARTEGGSHPVEDVQAVVPFAVFQTEFQYLLRDSEQEARNATDLAFEHLRRILAVDGYARKQWQHAFKQREEHCERLGAVHLLAHGLWAFKVTGIGAATDLVFGEPLAPEFALVKRTARALVLTEWKKVKAQGEVERTVEEARSQTDSYAAGILGDLELKFTRYIVLVVQKDLPAPADALEGAVRFRHVVLPIDPALPSRAAR